MKKNYLLILTIIGLSFIIGIYLYPKMPSKVAFHWNYKGEVDRYASKFWGLFLMPFLSTIMFVLFILIPKIDPLKNNIKKFESFFDTFVILFTLFLFYLYLLTIFWNLGRRFSLVLSVVPAFSLLFYYLGILLEKTHRNYFIGIRTPWTLSSDRVWNKTNRLGGKLFKIAAIIGLLGVVWTNCAFLLVIIPVVVASICVIIYSYYESTRD